jgi:hypothetical protein
MKNVEFNTSILHNSSHDTQWVKPEDSVKYQQFKAKSNVIQGAINTLYSLGLALP